MKQQFGKLTGVALGAALAMMSAMAADVSWDGGGGDALWSNAANWAPDGVPLVSQWVDIAAGATVDVDTTTAVGSLVRTLQGSTLNIPTGGQLYTNGGFYLGASWYAAAPAVVNVTGGVLSIRGEFQLTTGLQPGAGQLYMSAGEVYLADPSWSYMYVGNKGYSGGDGLFYMNGGKLWGARSDGGVSVLTVGNAGPGTVIVDGGFAQTLYLNVARRWGEMEVSGGTLKTYGIAVGDPGGAVADGTLTIGGSAPASITAYRGSGTGFALYPLATLVAEIDSGGITPIVVTAAADVSGTIDIDLLPATPEPATGTIYPLIIARSQLGTPQLAAEDQSDWALQIVGGELQAVYIRPTGCPCETVAAAVLAAACAALPARPTSREQFEGILEALLAQTLTSNGCDLDDPCADEIRVLLGL